MDDVIGELTEVSNTLSGEHYFIMTGRVPVKLAVLMVTSVVVGTSIVRAGEAFYWSRKRKQYEKEGE